MSNRRRLSIALFASMSTIASIARSEGATLTYTRSADAACPDEPSLRAAVAQKVGRDPFDGDDAFVDVHVERTSDELMGSVQVREGGTIRGTRTLSSTSSSCDELVAALVVTLSIALDPARFGVPPRRTAPPPTPSPADRPFADETAARPREDPPKAIRHPEHDVSLGRRYMDRPK